MDFKQIENKVVDKFIDLIMDPEEKDYSLKNISKKLKLKSSILQSLYPFEERTNNLYFMRIFLKNLDKSVLLKFQKEIENEKLTNFEKILEGIFLRFEELYKYKNAILKLSKNFNDKLINFNLLFLDNHIFMLKLLKFSGDKGQLIKLNLRAILLNALFIKNMNMFLKDDKDNINLIMRTVDNDLKKLFEVNIIFDEI